MVASSQNKPGRACGLGAFAVVLALVAAACESPPETVPSAPGLASDFLDRGLAYQEMGKYDQAIQDYSEAIRLRPDYAIAFNNRGNTYYRKRVYDQAMNDLSEAIRLKPDYALAYNNRGLAYWKMGQLDRAIEDFDEAIHLGTLEGDRKAWPYNNRGLVYYSRAEYRRAIRDFDQAIHINPNDTNALTNRSKANRRQGRFDEAIRDAGEAIRLGTLKKRQLARAYRIRGAAYAAKGEYDRAILEHNKAMAADPTYAGSYQNRGYALFFMGKFDEAVGDFRRSVSLDPDFSYGVIFYYLAQQRSGENGSSDLRQNAANVDLEKWPAQFIRLYLGELDPDQVLLSMPTGNTRYNKERLCEAYFFLGEYHLIQGNNSRAADFFEKALKTNIYYFIEYIAAKVELERMGSNSAAHNSWPISAIVAHARPAR